MLKLSVRVFCNKVSGRLVYFILCTSKKLLGMGLIQLRWQTLTISSNWFILTRYESESYELISDSRWTDAPLTPGCCKAPDSKIGTDVLCSTEICVQYASDGL